MSQRSLLELNHDQAHMILRYQRQFLDALDAFVSSASPENAERLSRFGLTSFGTRHHSEGFNITLGCHTASYLPAKEPSR